MLLDARAAGGDIARYDLAPSRMSSTILGRRREYDMYHRPIQPPAAHT